MNELNTYDWIYQIARIHTSEDREIKDQCVYLKKWRNYLFGSKITDRTKAQNIILKASSFLNIPDRPIVFVKGPKAAAELITKTFERIIDCNDYSDIAMTLYHLAVEKLNEKHKNVFRENPGLGEVVGKESEIFERICYGIYDLIYEISEYYFIRSFDIELGHINNSYLHYLIEIYKFQVESEIWDILKTLNQECPYFISLSELCIIIERPIEIHLDNELLPHAQDKPAIKFGDGWAVYCHHGIEFPAKYGKFPIDLWEPEWIFSEKTCEYRIILIYTIGYKKFQIQYPETKFWFWQDYIQLLCDSVNIIIDWQIYYYERLYLKEISTDGVQIDYADAIKISEHLPFKLPNELYTLYRYHNGGYQLAPNLYFYSLKQAIRAGYNLKWIKANTGYPFPLFKGTRNEIYYILANDSEQTYSHVYCIFPSGESMIYAECITSLIVTIAQCYRERAYYISINEESGTRNIRQDLDKIEPIFEKFNPAQIDNWRKIWR